MTQPTAEAYEAAAKVLHGHDRLVVLDEPTWEDLSTLDRDSYLAAAKSMLAPVWPLAVAVGRRLEAERLAPLVEAAKTWREERRGSSTLAKPATALIAVVDALTRGDTDNE